MLTEPCVHEQIPAESLFNFLCYIQSIDGYTVVERRGSKTVLNKYGKFIDNVFTIVKDAKKNREALINEFYDLLNNRKSFLRSIKQNNIKIKTENDMTPSFKPQLAPNTVRSKGRNNSRTSMQHGNELHLRSRKKEEKKKLIREESARKEMRECTFSPKINRDKRSSDGGSSWCRMSNSSRGNNTLN